MCSGHPKWVQNGSIKNFDLLETDFAHQWIVLWIWYSLYYAYLNCLYILQSFKWWKSLIGFMNSMSDLREFCLGWSRRDPKLDPKLVHVRKSIWASQGIPTFVAFFGIGSQNSNGLLSKFPATTVLYPTFVEKALHHNVFVFEPNA